MLIGVDIGGTNTSIGILDDKGSILFSVNYRTDREKDVAYIIKDVANSIKRMLEKNNIKRSSIKGVGLGIPGFVDFENGILTNSPNLSASNVNVKQILIDELGLPAFIDNDSNCATLAEYFMGRLKGYNNCMLITIGTGIGSGIIINGEPYRGKDFFAGEVGHMIIDINGKSCGCGKKGCWEQYASSKALRRIAVEHLACNQDFIEKYCRNSINNLSSKTVFDAADEGEISAKNILDEFYDYLAIGISNIINVLNPDAIAIGGSVSKRGDKMVQPLITTLQTKFQNNNLPPIFTAKFGREAGIMGAALLTGAFSI